MKVKTLERLPSGLFIVTDEGTGILFEEPIEIVAHSVRYEGEGVRVEEMDVKIERLKPISEKPDEGS